MIGRYLLFHRDFKAVRLYLVGIPQNTRSRHTFVVACIATYAAISVRLLHVHNLKVSSKLFPVRSRELFEVAVFLEVGEVALHVAVARNVTQDPEVGQQVKRHLQPSVPWVAVKLKLPLHHFLLCFLGNKQISREEHVAIPTTNNSNIPMHAHAIILLASWLKQLVYSSIATNISLAFEACRTTS
jgi:hypothetical protein